jgi:hypothetical protein
VEVVRLYIRGGMPLSEARELFADLERAHDTLVAVDALALSFVDRPKRFYRRYVEEFGPFGPVWPGMAGSASVDLLRSEPSRLLLPSQRMSLVRAELSSPGSFDVGGVGRGVDGVTNALRYRQERREGKKYRDEDREIISEAEAREASARADEQEERARQAAFETERARRANVFEEIAFRGRLQDAVESGLVSREEAALLVNTSVDALQQLHRGIAGELVEGVEPLQSNDIDQER